MVEGDQRRLFRSLTARSIAGGADDPFFYEGWLTGAARLVTRKHLSARAALHIVSRANAADAATLAATATRH
jgi:hypothetical protein